MRVFGHDRTALYLSQTHAESGLERLRRLSLSDLTEGACGPPLHLCEALKVLAGGELVELNEPLQLPTLPQPKAGSRAPWIERRNPKASCAHLM